MRPPTRRAYSLRHAQPPKSPIETPSGGRSCTPCRRCRRTPSTTARGRSFFTLCRISSNQLKTSGRVSPVATRPSTPPTDSIAGLAPGGADDRVARGDHERVAGDPEAELLLRRERELPRRARASAGLGATEGVGPPAVAPVGVATARVRGGRGRCRSRPHPERPTSAWTPLRGRSSRRAWLTSASGPGEGERDVALPAVRLVVGRLVDAGRVQQEADARARGRRRRARGPRSTASWAARRRPRGGDGCASRPARARTCPAARRCSSVRVSSSGSGGSGGSGAVGHQNWK